MRRGPGSDSSGMLDSSRQAHSSGSGGPVGSADSPRSAESARVARRARLARSSQRVDSSGAAAAYLLADRSRSGDASQAVAALQKALAAEQAAIYGYGVVGARLPQGSADQAAATTDWVAHMRAGDQLSALITARGATPVPAAVAYELPGPVRNPAAAKALAVTLEERVAQAYLAVVALPESGLRSFGAGQVRAAALRAQAWSGSVQAFPGLPPASL
jgi:hypothetical protein